MLAGLGVSKLVNRISLAISVNIAGQQSLHEQLPLMNFSRRWTWLCILLPKSTNDCFMNIYAFSFICLPTYLSQGRRRQGTNYGGGESYDARVLGTPETPGPPGCLWQLPRRLDHTVCLLRIMCCALLTAQSTTQRSDSVNVGLGSVIHTHVAASTARETHRCQWMDHAGHGPSAPPHCAHGPIASRWCADSLSILYDQCHSYRSRPVRMCSTSSLWKASL